MSVSTSPPAVMPPPVPARRPWVGFVVDCLLAGLLLLAFTFAGMLGWMVLSAVMDPPAAADPAAITARMESVMGIVPMLVVGSLAMLATAWVLYLLRRRATPDERAVSRHAATQARTWIEATGLGVVLFAIGTALMWGLDAIGYQPEASNTRMLEEALAFSPWLLLGIAVLVAPLSEELLFRRVLFGRLWAAGAPLKGMIASGLLFGLMHEIPAFGSGAVATLILLVFYTLMGIAMAWIYRRLRTLWAPILTHATNNLLGCLAMIAGYGS